MRTLKRPTIVPHPSYLRQFPALFKSTHLRLIPDDTRHPDDRTPDNTPMRDVTSAEFLKGRKESEAMMISALRKSNFIF